MTTARPQAGRRAGSHGERRPRPSSTRPPWHRRFDARRRLHFFTALAAGLAADLLTWSFGDALAEARLAPFAAVAFAAALLGGGAGIAGAATGRLLFAVASRLPLGAGLVFSLAWVPAGVLAWTLFRRLPSLGRGLSDRRSYLALLGAALAGLLLAVGLESAALAWAAPPVAEGAEGFRGIFRSRAAAAWVSILVLVPPILVAARHYWPSRLARIPSEIGGGAPAARPGGGARSEESGQETVLVTRLPNADGFPRRSFVLVAVQIAAVSGAAVLLLHLSPASGGWMALLYLLPVLWAAQEEGLTGGLLAASGAGLVFLLVAAGIGRETVAGAVPAELTFLSLLGAFLGAGQDREESLREELLGYNRLLRQDLLRVVQALTSAVEAKDSYTEGHLRRVSEYALAVGERLGLPGRELETLFYGSMLHDIGKIGVPEEVLRKEGPLDDAEVEAMRLHPEIGARIVRDLDVLSEAAPIILHHQERWDGATDGPHPGYPHGLAGEAIPIGARIVAVVDAFDAMTTDRPYRRGLSVQVALERLAREKGSQFDPTVVDAFTEIVVRRGWS